MNEAMWWLTVVGYLVTAVLCAIAALKQKTNKNKGERNIWWGLAASMLVLGINKQKNLTGILTDLGRQNAFQVGWYSVRSGLQLLLVGVFLLVGLVLLVLLVRYRHAVGKLQWIAIVGVIFLFSFALIRAVSLHTVDAFLYTSIAGLQPNWIVELGGISLVTIPAIVALVKKDEKGSGK